MRRESGRLGKWPDGSGGAHEVEIGSDEEQLLLELGSAAVQGRTALGERAGARRRNHQLHKATEFHLHWQR